MDPNQEQSAIENAIYKYQDCINLYNRHESMNDPLHSPTLSTILMVEQTMKKMDYQTKTQLWKALPKKVMYQTFCVIIDYLIESGKIMVDTDNRLVWTWNPEMIKKILSSGVKLR